MDTQKKKKGDVCGLFRAGELHRHKRILRQVGQHLLLFCRKRLRGRATGHFEESGAGVLRGRGAHNHRLCQRARGRANAETAGHGHDSAPGRGLSGPHREVRQRGTRRGGKPKQLRGRHHDTAPAPAYARLLDDWSYYMRRPMAGRTGWVGRLQQRLPWRRSRTVVIPMLYIGGTAESARDLGSVLRDCEVRHAGEAPLQLLWTSSPSWRSHAAAYAARVAVPASVPALTLARRTPCWTSAAAAACTTGRATSSISAAQPTTTPCLEGGSVSAWCSWRRCWARWLPQTRYSSGRRDLFLFFF